MSEDIYVESKQNKNIVQVAHTNVKESEKLAETYAKNAEKSSMVCQNCVNTVQNIITEYENEIVENTYDDTQLRNDLAEVRGSVPAKTSDLTNDSGFITSSDVPANVSELINDSGFISGITGSDVSDALGYTPANDSGLVHNTGTETIAGSKTFSNTIVADKGLTLDDSGTGLQIHYPLEFKINDGVLDFKIESSTTGGVTTNTFKAHTDISGLKSDIKFIDGQWVAKEATLSTTTATGSYTIDLSVNDKNYLPNDNHNYEVLLTLKMSSSNSSPTGVLVYSDIIPITNDVISQKSTGSGTFFNSSYINLPVTRYLYLKINNKAAADCQLRAVGYRRIGTNS